MPTLLNQVIGAAALLLGAVWIARPLLMIRLQYRVLYFWRDEDPDLSNVSVPVARMGGVVLMVLGGLLLLGRLG